MADLRHPHHLRDASDLDLLLGALGVSPLDFLLERSRFRLSPREWLARCLERSGIKSEPDPEECSRCGDAPASLACESCGAPASLLCGSCR